MSEASFLQKLQAPRLPPTVSSEAEPDSVENGGSFGWLRGVRERAMMLELRKREGSILAVSYGWMEICEYDPSDGIRLTVGHRRIRIQGRHLNLGSGTRPPLFEGIARHRVAWLRETDRAEQLTAKLEGLVITSIDW